MIRSWPTSNVQRLAVIYHYINVFILVKVFLLYNIKPIFEPIPNRFKKREAISLSKGYDNYARQNGKLLETECVLKHQRHLIRLTIAVKNDAFKYVLIMPIHSNGFP